MFRLLHGLKIKSRVHNVVRGTGCSNQYFYRRYNAAPRRCLKSPFLDTYLDVPFARLYFGFLVRFFSVYVPSTSISLLQNLVENF